MEEGLRRDQIELASFLQLFWIPKGNKVENFIFMEVFHLLIKEGITELFYYFSTSSKLTDLGKDQQ